MLSSLVSDAPIPIEIRRSDKSWTVPLSALTFETNQTCSPRKRSPGYAGRRSMRPRAIPRSGPDPKCARLGFVFDLIPIFEDLTGPARRPAGSRSRVWPLPRFREGRASAPSKRPTAARPTSERHAGSATLLKLRTGPAKPSRPKPGDSPGAREPVALHAFSNFSIRAASLFAHLSANRQQRQSIPIEPHRRPPAAGGRGTKCSLPPSPKPAPG